MARSRICILAFQLVPVLDIWVVHPHFRSHFCQLSNYNFRAAVSSVSHILATTACGSLREEIGRGDFIVLDQFIDLTKHRKTTFFESFEDGAHHTAMAEPFDSTLRRILVETASELNLKVHARGTVITIEGPRFSSKAESKMYRLWGADVVNMSVASEAILANEIQIPYAAVAMSTDYDCWKEDEAPVTWDEILEVFKKNAANVEKLLINAVPKIK